MSMIRRASDVSTTTATGGQAARIRKKQQKQQKQQTKAAAKQRALAAKKNLNYSKNLLLADLDELEEDEDYDFSDVEEDFQIMSIESNQKQSSFRGSIGLSRKSSFLKSGRIVGLGKDSVRHMVPSDNNKDEAANDGGGSFEKLNKMNVNNATLSELLAAAEADIAVYTSKMINPNETPQGRKERHQRQVARDEALKELKSQKDHILAATKVPIKESSAEERIKERLTQWERALELYVHEPDAGIEDASALLELLCTVCNEENEFATALSSASNMVKKLVKTTASAVEDAVDDMMEAEAAYRIKLEAHARYASKIHDDMELLSARFRTDGQAAIKIGQQLEMAEAKRRHCETTSLLIRRWWMMETLAEKERESEVVIPVHDEVIGAVKKSSCQLDPLFTEPENSLDASLTLKSLREIIKSSASSPDAQAVAKSSTQSPESRRKLGTSKNSALKRFELTSSLIDRVSASLEHRLLASFSSIYEKGGVYDFAEFRHGRMDWVTLKHLAQALFCFDEGRNLQTSYVNQVVTNRFPEFQKMTGSHKQRGPSVTASVNENDEYGTDDDCDDADYDMDETRSKLSNLFHRVSEVCTAEFALIAHIFNFPRPSLGGELSDKDMSAGLSSADTRPLQVARALLHRVISDSRGSLQTRIDRLLADIRGNSAYDIGAKRLDTFVVIHEKAAGLFSILREYVEKYLFPSEVSSDGSARSNSTHGKALLHFLSSQELSLCNSQRKGYLNLELRLLHHECCSTIERAGGALSKAVAKKGTSKYLNLYGDRATTSFGDTATFVAPIMMIENAGYIQDKDIHVILDTILKPSVLRQPLIHATDSLARAQLMFAGKGIGSRTSNQDSTSNAISAIYAQMCNFYGPCYLFPVMEALESIIYVTPPSTAPSLPSSSDDEVKPHDLGVESKFWVAIERIHSAAKAFDRELWAENRSGSSRVYESLLQTRNQSGITLAKERRLRFFRILEENGEACVSQALDTICAHIQWILVSGGESMLATGGNRLLQRGGNGGPYLLSAGTSLTDANSPAVKYLTYSVRSLFVNVQSALSPSSLSNFWTILSARIYDIICARLLQNYTVSTVGAVILSRDIESLRSISMLSGTNHSHWDTLRELLALYMTGPDAVKTILVGPEGEIHSGKGLFHRVGQEQSLVFLSRREDFKVKTGMMDKRAEWVTDLLEELGVSDPTEGNKINVSKFTADRS